jgi:hypothetical protein
MRRGAARLFDAHVENAVHHGEGAVAGFPGAGTRICVALMARYSAVGLRISLNPSQSPAHVSP